MSDRKAEEAQKRELRIRRNFSFRLNLFFFITFGLFSMLIVRLAVLQFVEADELKSKKSILTTDSVPIPPIRGNIYDSEGRPIAYSASTQSLYYTLRSKVKPEDALELATRIAAVFMQYGDASAGQMTPEQIVEKMDLNGRTHNPYEQRRIKSGLTQKEVAYLSEHRDEFKDLDIVEESIRQYSPDRVAVQLVGYMNKMQGAKANIDFYKTINDEQDDPALEYLDLEDVGIDGLERMYQAELRGLNGYKTYEVDNMSKIVGGMQLTKPVKGQNLYLTINRAVQLEAQDAIMKQIEQIKHSTAKQLQDAQPTTGYAVAMEVDTGKVIAMASMPDYDPNVWQGGVSTETWNQIMPFIANGTIREVYPPYTDSKERAQHPTSLVPLGSTQKPLSILVGLNEKLITPSTRWTDPGYFAFGAKGYETEVQNASRAANGSLTPTMAIAKSSNAFMAANVGNALYYRDGDEGVDIWDSYMKQFGLGVKTESGLPSESSGTIEYYHELESGSAQSALIYASFGQQGKYTTLQLAQYASMLANRGKRMQPQFVERRTDSDGNVVASFQPNVLSTVDFPDVYWETIEKGMDQVGVQGFENTNYTFRRKTGTSQQKGVGQREFVENAVFIAYAPAEKPKLAVAVVVPDGGYGGWGAAPIARKIFDAYDAAVGLTDAGPRQPAAIPETSLAFGL
ncbi:penicillin-binding transpeptidase domain-containing protein [Cohnella lubricantis]|uniref:Penicillin-binding protein 2 n=1 Tax=Cohnella lubricantis TaxID=2163172 RepID=A0A841TH50_9BACL|nr:penicillin-binding transpeptidase domain-containing protein [Cohnella lubricantis]MBB6678277.1 penicillin-binding protein 2 [Cohnella lubricantis]MBP2118479.1 penicillin-binding protein 2 [Cohnella lubricantis]